ncbi:MAG: type I polyketide synthase [Pseudomonadota bacterium]
MTASSSTRSQSDEIAISGYACRLPGAPDADAFWSLMMEGRSAIQPIPRSRFDIDRFYRPSPSIPGKTYANAAGLIENIYDFDAAFFGISPREAAQMDPQQRLLLHVTWEAIEHAKLTSGDIAGARCGVFVGAASCDHMVTAFESPETMGATFMTGNTMSILANRLAYQFNIKGPSSTIDTACSSSLFALHQASLALRAGEIDRAIVAGVNLLLSPYPFIGFSRASMLSPDGECRAFDASANGYVRGEGAVVMVLERADIAKTRGAERSWLAGIGVNSDGTKAGISLPSGTGQEDLLKRVWSEIDHDPDQIGFVEAHGTGTPVGDPIEAYALGQAISHGRTSPLPIGSAKTNVGHLEAGSGMVGLLKAQLALEHGVLPPSGNFETPNPDIDFDGLNLQVAQDPVSLSVESTLFAGVNSFGFGGTNGHAVLKRVKMNPMAVIPASCPPALILTAATEESLLGLAGRWHARLAKANSRTRAELVSAAAHRRTRLRHRLVINGGETDLLDGLEHAARSAEFSSIAMGTTPDISGQTAFVFCGNGAQWAGMGVPFYADEPAFRRGFDRVAKIAESLGQEDLVGLLHAPDLADRLEDGLIAQPLLFAVQVALVEALIERGLRPAMVAGHSMGEVAAAWAAGCLSLEQACELVYSRASAMVDLRGTGGMAAVLAGAEKTKAALVELGFAELELAGDNSPRSTTISGEATRIAEFARAARKRRLAVQRLPVAYPYHSEAMESIRDEMARHIGKVAPQEGHLRLFSSTLGHEIAGGELNETYWWRNARQAVLFRDAVTGLCEAGITSFVEIGPRPLLKTYIADTAQALGKRVTVTVTLDQDRRAPGSVDQIVARALANGAEVETETYFGAELRTKEDLPSYPWSSKTLKHERSDGHINLLGEELAHPLLGHRTTEDSTIWHADLDVRSHPWLADHMVDGAVLLPATGFVEIGLAALRTQVSGPVEIRDLDLLAPLVLDVEGAQTVRIRTTLEPETGLFRVESRPHASAGEWILHARGVGSSLAPKSGRDPMPRLAFLPEWQASELYEALSDAGLDYGPAFRRVARVEVGSGRGLSHLIPHSTLEDAVLDPALADAGLHGLYPLLTAGAGPGSRAMIPTRIGRVRLWKDDALPSRADLVLTQQSQLGASATMRLTAQDGNLIAEFEDVRLKSVDRGAKNQTTIPLLQEIMVPVAGAMHRPEILEDPEKVLARISGLTELSEIDLLVDVAARRIAWEHLKTDDVDQQTRQRLQALIEEEVNRLDGETAPFPSIPELLATMLEIEPKCTEPLLGLLHRRRGLIDAGSETQFDEPTRAAISLWPKAHAILFETCQAWPNDAPLRLLLLGDVPQETPGSLLRDRPELQVTIAGASAREQTKLERRFSEQPSVTVAALESALAAGPYDLVVACDCATDLLAWPKSTHAKLDDAALGIVLLEAELNAYDVLSPTEESRKSDLETRIRGLAQLFEELDRPYSQPFGSSEGVAQVIVSAKALEPSQEKTVHLLGREPRLEAALMALGARLVNAQQEASSAVAVLPLETSRTGFVTALRALLPDLELFGTVWCIAGPETLPEEAAWVKGYLRVLANEIPSAANIRFAQMQPQASVDCLAKVILDDRPETEFVASETAAVSPVLVAVDQREASLDLAEPSWMLEAARPGDLDTLNWMPVERREPEANEVEIEVCATGLNFRDVMWAQRLLPAEALEAGYAGAELGMECAGRISRAGAESGFAIGDPVLACASKAFSRHVTVGASSVLQLPNGMEPELAAGLPVAFLTAHFALIEQARLRPGETVLIHGAAGGVGQAAIQVAQKLGARIICSAGTAEKRDFLEMLGVDHVVDSRNLRFLQQIEQLLDGDGVDVVLNCLAGDAMEASLRLLNPFGRFIELGKQDLYGNRHIGLRALRNNVSYFAVDLDQMMAAHPARMRVLLQEVLAGFDNGVYRPIPTRVFSSDATTDAFRLMQGSGHLGKIVIKTPESLPSCAATPDLSGGWLITGGFTGLGLAIAEWLVAQGADEIWLASRSGAPRDQEDQARIDALAAKIELHKTRIDITDAEAVDHLFDAISSQGTKLKGVIHAAMVLDDDRIEDLDLKRLNLVAAPKIKGTGLLDQASRRLEPEHFVALSSVATLIGNPGQAAYSAANAGMEEIIRSRRAAGLPALSIGLGPVADQGHLARDVRVRDHLERQLGDVLLSTDQVLETLAKLLADPPVDPVVYAAQMPWSQLSETLATLSTPRFDRIDRRAPTGFAQAGSQVADLADLDDEAARAKILDALREETARILRLPLEEVDPFRPMTDLGFDSLMAVDLKLAAEEHLGITMPLMALGDQINLTELASRILSRVRTKGASGDESSVVDDLVEKHVVGSDAHEADQEPYPLRRVSR